MASTTPTRSADQNVPDKTRRTLPFKKKADPMAATTAAPPGPETKTKGGKKKKIILLLPVLLVIAGAVWFFVLRDTGPSKPEAPKPGAITTLEPITVNLTTGHYLKLGLSLQQSAKVSEKVDGAKALDLSIELFGGRSIDDLADKEKREKLKATLVKEISAAYEDEVYDIYFSQFVWQ